VSRRFSVQRQALRIDTLNGSSLFSNNFLIQCLSMSASLRRFLFKARRINGLGRCDAQRALLCCLTRCDLRIEIQRAILLQGPRVRILLPPAESLLRTRLSGAHACAGSTGAGDLWSGHWLQNTHGRFTLFYKFLVEACDYLPYFFKLISQLFDILYAARSCILKFSGKRKIGIDAFSG
jgi:hypothetical protein